MESVTRKHIDWQPFSISEPGVRGEYANLVNPEKEIDTDHIFSIDGVDQYLDSIRDGTFKMGLSTGSACLDKNFRFKRQHFNVVNGYDNVGKSVLLWFLMLLSARKYAWKWIVFTGENSKGSFYRHCIEFLNGEWIKSLSREVYEASKKFITDHFALITNDESYTYQDILDISTRRMQFEKYDGILIDPYNSLDEASNTNSHSYHYKACLAMQHFTRKNDCCIYLNCHAVTGAFRKLSGDGYATAPNKADTEGGTKFASKADDFLTIHRLTNHEQDWRVTQVHVRKVKEIETGGFPTMKDSPVLLQMIKGNVGFVDRNSWNPLTEKTYQTDWSRFPENYLSMEDEPINKITPEKEEEVETERMPF